MFTTVLMLYLELVYFNYVSLQTKVVLCMKAHYLSDLEKYISVLDSKFFF